VIGTNKRFCDGGDEFFSFVVTEDILSARRVKTHHEVYSAFEMGRKARERPSVW